jgi:hypothetical protein
MYINMVGDGAALAPSKFLSGAIVLGIWMRTF